MAVNLTGTVVAGKWRLVSLLGEGATGSVYRAEDGGEAVAVKILRAELGTSASRAEVERRFEREALAAAHAQHPNCVTVRDFGALEDGRPYLVMDLVEGRSLGEVIAAEKMLPVSRALKILAHILRGLDHAHRAGVVHRDLKPADIVLVDRGGDRDTAVILDFGTAALIGAAGASQEPLARAGTTIGTPLYMAPERLGAGPIDGRADLYSATCILFEMVTGKPPYDGDSPIAVLKAHASAPIPMMADAAPEVKSSPGLDAVLMRGLAKIPANRFASAAEYLAAVEALIEGKLDHLSLGRSAPGALAQPDANKATTVFHGAPDAIRAAAAAVAPPARMPAATPIPGPAPAPAPLPPLPAAMAPHPQAASPVAAAVEPPGATPAEPDEAAAPASRTGARLQRKHIIAAAAAGVGLALVLVLASRGCGGKGDGGGSASLEDGWREAGLDPGGFAKIDGQALGHGECKAGAVNGLDVTLCNYKSPELAAQARKSGLATIGLTTGAAIVNDDQMLIVADRKKSDPSGRAIDKVIKVFLGKPLTRPGPPPTTGKTTGKSGKSGNTGK